MTRLSKEEWNLLDDLLGKIGFGGYYDMLEYLNMVASDLAKIAGKEVDKQRNLKDAITTISGLTIIIKRKYENE